jgi:hypothetical protein
MQTEELCRVPNIDFVQLSKASVTFTCSLRMTDVTGRVWSIVGVPGVILERRTEIALSAEISLVATNELLLSARSKLDLNERQFRSLASCPVFLVRREYQPLIRGAERKNSIERVQDALMAFQIIKPIETYGFLFQGQESTEGSIIWETTVYRWPMRAGDWAQMRGFDAQLIDRAEEMLLRVQSAMGGVDVGKRNAIHLLQLALEHPHPLIACLLAVTGMEALLKTTGRWEFKRELCLLLGASTLAFPDWNSPHFLPPDHTVEDLAIDLFTLRSKVAHGVDLREAVQDKNCPVDLAELKPHVFSNLNGYSRPSEMVTYATLLGEASIYLLTQVLQKVL